MPGIYVCILGIHVLIIIFFIRGVFEIKFRKKLRLLTECEDLASIDFNLIKYMSKVKSIRLVRGEAYICLIASLSCIQYFIL